MHAATRRKQEKQQRFLAAYSTAKSIEEACRATDISSATVRTWMRDGTFRLAYDEMAKVRQGRLRSARIAGKDQYGLVYDDTRPIPPKGTFTEWRPRYIGRSVEPHQEELVAAYEDRTNLVVIALLPPGAGKDTTAGDFLLYETCDDREHRAAWIMRGESFARRRIAERIDPYLTDPRTYSNSPPGATSVKPERNLIEDYGPFKYKKGMVDHEGNKLDPTTWTKNEIYFLKSGAPEADPNLWATGMEGQLYGSRIDTLVMSDVFDRENQMTSTARESQYAWVMGTALSRLDEAGRLLILGTRCLPGDNYERIINSLVGDANVVHQGRHYTKYANGVAVVVMPAIEHDENGNEVSYWPDRFPLDSHFEMPNGERVAAAEVSDDIVNAYGGRVKRIRGLREIRERDEELFETMYQQNPPSIITGDFTDHTLNAADDEARTFQTYKPSELLVVGADPARSAGAAWVVWGVDRERNTITLIDYFFGSKLGISGLKSKLVVDPIVKYRPVWYCYEVNREAAVVEDPEIQRVFDDYGVNLHRHQTHSANRSNPTIGVPSMSFYMKARVIRWPMMTAADRQRMILVKDHFKTWDRKEALDLSRAALKGHPDDLAMAAWVGFVKALELLQRRTSINPMQAMPVPAAVQRKWDRMAARNKERRYINEREQHAAPSMKELVSMVLGGTYGSDG